MKYYQTIKDQKEKDIFLRFILQSKLCSSRVCSLLLPVAIKCNNVSDMLRYKDWASRHVICKLDTKESQQISQPQYRQCHNERSRLTIMTCWTVPRASTSHWPVCPKQDAFVAHTHTHTHTHRGNRFAFTTICWTLLCLFQVVKKQSVPHIKEAPLYQQPQKTYIFPQQP